MKLAPFQKCIVFSGYYGDIHVAIKPELPVFSQCVSTLFANMESDHLNIFVPAGSFHCFFSFPVVKDVLHS